LWISQADSDIWAAARVYDPLDARTFCQAIAKYQQAVEKSVKAVVAGQQGRLRTRVKIGYGHDALPLAQVLRRGPRPTESTDVQQKINRMFNDYVLSEIEAIDALAPRRPAPGDLHVRNTEYPYQSVAGNWTAPALPGNFQTSQVERFRSLADRVHQGAKEIVGALRR
jgi:HEPN domain-containing protein